MVAASIPVPLGPWWSTDLQGPHTLRGSEGIPKSPVFSCTRRNNRREAALRPATIFRVLWARNPSENTPSCFVSS